MLRVPSRPRSIVRALTAALLAVTVGPFLLSCAARQPLFVYRAYQKPESTEGPYYLRDALVVAPDHASAMDIITKAMTEIHPAWSGPLYISFIGQSEERRHPGLLGGPVWLAATDSGTAPPDQPETPGELDIRGDISSGAPEG